MQKYIKINRLQDVDIIQCNALSVYIYNRNDAMKSLSLIPIFIISYMELFQKILLLLKI